MSRNRTLLYLSNDFHSHGKDCAKLKIPNLCQSNLVPTASARSPLQAFEETLQVNAGIHRNSANSTFIRSGDSQLLVDVDRALSTARRPDWIRLCIPGLSKVHPMLWSGERSFIIPLLLFIS